MMVGGIGLDVVILLLVLVGLALFGMAALRFGYDSRDMADPRQAQREGLGGTPWR